MRTFVFGDIHGSYKELVDTLSYVIEKKSFGKKDKLVFIGDYVDRGFQSKQVIDHLIELKKEYPKTVFLRGNHEDMFMGFIGIKHSRYSPYFIMNGGMTTIASYAKSDLPRLEDFRKYSQEAQEAVARELKAIKIEDAINLIPDSHKEFLNNTKLYHDTKNVLFVHAGVNPYVETIKEQTEDTLIWVNDNRDRFFAQISKKPWSKLLVHGHTPIEPDKVLKYADRNRINVDTGFVYGGRLTCMIIDPDKEPSKYNLVQNTGEKIKEVNP